MSKKKFRRIRCSCPWCWDGRSRKRSINRWDDVAEAQAGLAEATLYLEVVSRVPGQPR